MSIFLKNQKYLYWISNLHFYFSLKKSKYVKSLLYSIVWSISLTKYSYKLRMYSIMNTFLFELKKKCAFYFLSSISNFKYYLLSYLKFNYFNRFRKYFKNAFLFYKYWISYYFDEFMQYAPLHSMAKIMPIIFRFLKKSTFFLKSRKKKFRYISRFLKKAPKFLFLRFKSRSLYTKTIKKFKIRTYLKSTAKLNRYSDYSKYQLSLFFICSYNLTFDKVRSLYTRYAYTENLITFKDLFLFLDRKLDLFLKNIYSFSNLDIISVLSNKQLFINGIAVTHRNTFVTIGDFIYLCSMNTNVYSRLHISSIDFIYYRSWFYFFFFFNSVKFFNTLNLMNLVYIKKIKQIYFSIFFKYVKYSFLVKRMTNIWSSNLKVCYSNYLELIKGWTSFLLIKQKNNTFNNVYYSWHTNLHLEKSHSYRYVLDFSVNQSIELINLFSKLKLLWLNKVTFFIILSIKMFFMYTFLKNKKSKSYYFKLLTRKFELFNLSKLIVLNIFCTTNTFEISYLSKIILRKYIYFDRVESFFFEMMLLEQDSFKSKSNNLSYWWLFYTYQLKKIKHQAYTVKYLYNKYRIYSFSLKKKILFKLNVKKKMYTRSRYYFKQDFYNFPKMYFEPLSCNNLNLYDHKFSILHNEKKILLYTYLNSLLFLKSNFFITYKNVTFIYKLPKQSSFEVYNSKWFQVFNINDISLEVLKNYL